jgi:Uri superfamily endonuclease
LSAHFNAAPTGKVRRLNAFTAENQTTRGKVRAVGQIADWEIAQFGSSDCNCFTHLFGMHTDPLHTPAFIELLQYFRMDRLEEELGQYKLMR